MYNNYNNSCPDYLNPTNYGQLGSYDNQQQSSMYGGYNQYNSNYNRYGGFNDYTGGYDLYNGGYNPRRW